MSMTKEEAITCLQEKYDYCKSFYDLAAHPEEDYPEMKKYLQALQIALSALRPVTREQAEKMRGKFFQAGIDDVAQDTWRCSRCLVQEFGNIQGINFCPSCGAPMTDEGVDMVMEILEAMKDGNSVKR